MTPGAKVPLCAKQHHRRSETVSASPAGDRTRRSGERGCGQRAVAQSGHVGGIARRAARQWQEAARHMNIAERENAGCACSRQSTISPGCQTKWKRRMVMLSQSQRTAILELHAREWATRRIARALKVSRACSQESDPFGIESFRRRLFVRRKRNHTGRRSWICMPPARGIWSESMKSCWQSGRSSPIRR